MRRGGLGDPAPPGECQTDLAETVRAVRQAAGGVPVITAGLSWLQHLAPYVAAGMVSEGWCDLVDVLADHEGRGGAGRVRRARRHDLRARIPQGTDPS